MEVFHPNYSRVEGAELYAGSIASEEPPSIFLTNAFHLKFMVRKAPRYSSAMIEQIIVEVTEFQPPLPEVFPVWGVMPLQEDNLYLVNIDEPKNGVSETFVCEHYFTDVTKRIAETRFAAAKLESQPEKIVLRIDAKRHGLYKFKVSMIVSAGDQKETIPVASETVHYPLPPKFENNVQEIGN